MHRRAVRTAAQVLIAAALTASLGLLPSATAPSTPSRPIAVGAAATATVTAFGDAANLGSAGDQPLANPVVGIVPTATGAGYWLVASDGGVFSFGDAAFHGSTGAVHLNQPIVAMAASPTGSGYWLVARDGGVFSFGDARFAGSAGNAGLDEAIIGMAALPSGNGYRMVAADGTVYAFGDARLLPASGGQLGTANTAMASTTDGSGYWIAGRHGAVAAYGSASTYGTGDAQSLVVGVAGTKSGKGYWVATQPGDVAAGPATGPSTGSYPFVGYAFLGRTPSGAPLHHDPCRVLWYVINPAGAPTGMVTEVKEALRRLNAVSGLQFGDAGTTTETHIRIGVAKRPSVQVRYGAGQWAPILVSWTSAAQEPILAGAVLGYGGSSSYWTSTSDIGYVTGEAVFDRDLATLQPGFGVGRRRGNLAMHELGHVAGLDHVNDNGALMNPEISASTPDGYGPGDLAGLSRVGADAGCLRLAAPPAP